jgi:hypothetical protein
VFRILVKLFEEFYGRLQAPLAALGLQDSVVKPPDLLDCRQPLGANCLVGDVGADLRKLDAQPDLMLL